MICSFCLQTTGFQLNSDAKTSWKKPPKLFLYFCTLSICLVKLSQHIVMNHCQTRIEIISRWRNSSSSSSSWGFKPRTSSHVPNCFIYLLPAAILSRWPSICLSPYLLLCLCLSPLQRLSTYLHTALQAITIVRSKENCNNRRLERVELD